MTMCSNLQSNLQIVPYHIYIIQPSAYAASYVLICKEQNEGNLCLDVDMNAVKASTNKVFGRRKHSMMMLRGQRIMYGKINIDNLEYDLTNHIIHVSAAKRIERYWIRYRENFLKRKAINILKPYLLHWAYKPSGVLGKRVIQSLKNRCE